MTTTKTSKEAVDWKGSKELGQLIASMRKKHGWNQNELAQKIGLTAGYVSHFEQGRARPRRRIIPTLAKVLGIPTDELLRLANYEVSDGDFEPEGETELEAPFPTSIEIRANENISSDRVSLDKNALPMARVNWAIQCIVADPTYRLPSEYSTSNLPDGLKILVIRLYQAETKRQLLTAEELESLNG